MSLKLNNLETETLVKAISYVLDTNDQENIPDVIELVYALQSGAENTQTKVAKAPKINYGTILSVLENFVLNMENVKNEENLYDGVNVHILLKEANKIEREEYLPYLNNAKELKDRLFKELKL